MKLTKEEREIYKDFAKAAMQGWLAHYPEGTLITHLNYGVIATGAFRMASAMMSIYKKTLP